MAVIYSESRTKQNAEKWTGTPPDLYRNIAVYSEEADLTGMAAADVLHFRKGAIPEGSILLTGLSYIKFDDLGIGGTVDVGYTDGSVSDDDAFCTLLDTDTAAGLSLLTESATHPFLFNVGSDFAFTVKRNGTAVTGSPKVRFVAVYIRPEGK